MFPEAAAKVDRSRKDPIMSLKQECMLLYLVHEILEKTNLDNTFSVNTSKTVFFIFSNHPLSLPPLLRDTSADFTSITDSSLATTFSGILYKKRRKKLQGKSFSSPH